MTLKELIENLVGKTIVEVTVAEDCDSGLNIKLHDGSILNIGYSGCEGYTTFNGTRIPELD